jgi:hypothetical protein
MSNHVKSYKTLFLVYILLLTDLDFCFLFSCPPGKKGGRNFPGGYYLGYELFSRKRNSMRCHPWSKEIIGRFFESDFFEADTHGQARGTFQKTSFA